jgi:LDH2 family malate/lactate/ureidoglycolate dehydrogenase
VRAIEAGVLIPAESPSLEWTAPAVAIVDGRRGFGCEAADAVAKALVEALGRAPLAAVALRNANHVGRLASLGEAVARSGNVVLGFCNFLGAGQRVVPYGGATGRLCTNPLLFACPRGSDDVLVIDLTTSVVAEGRVRARLLAGEPLPAGWLVDSGWNAVTDGERLYESPPSAFLLPLGGREAGHKGFALALMVEILAGLLSGAGFARADLGPGGNGGLFLGLRPNVFGVADSVMRAQLEALLAFVATDAPAAPGFGAVRVPGERGRAALAAGRVAGTLSIPAALVDELRALARAT